MTQAQARILVVDDDAASTAVVEQDLGECGFRVVTASDIESGLHIAGRRQIDVVLLDIELPRKAGGPRANHGVEAIGEFRSVCPDAEVILFSSHDEARLGMEAIRRGAFDFVTKPYDPKALVGAVTTALEHRRARDEVLYLREEVQALKGGPMVAGRSEKMRKLLEMVSVAAPTDATILIAGETGTGKEMLARFIHAQSPRKQGPFIAVNVAAIPRELVESTLFGHERGAFTGAVQSQAGRFETARGGTIFLDEIGELHTDLQVKLLRVLQEKEFERVGSAKVLNADVRVLAATNRDLRAEVKKGAFREDLFFRLNVVPVALPSLRERIEDMASLMELFLERYAKTYGRPVPGVHPRVTDHLKLYEWPGNIRELEHLAQRLVIIKRPGETIVEDDLPIEYRYPAMLGAGEPREDQPEGAVLKTAVETFERDFLLKTLERCGWNRYAAAGQLGIHPATLFRKLNKHGLYGTAVEPLRANAGKHNGT